MRIDVDSSDHFFSGFDIIGWLSHAAFTPESMVRLLEKIPSTAGHAATAYAIYKVVDDAD